MKRVAQLKLLSAEHSLLGLGGTRVDSDLERETIFRLFGGEVIVKVAKEPQDSRPSSILENGQPSLASPAKRLGSGSLRRLPRPWNANRVQRDDSLSLS
jgi:hypothetical protein